MLKPLICIALSVASLLAAGCSPSADKAGPTGRPAAPADAGLDSGLPVEQAESDNAALAPNADPGMNPNRDKTPDEELPSGDESSQAAPNDGDAEPPARP